MLILQRNRDEEIILTVPPSSESTTIRLVVVNIDKFAVKLGIDAPPSTVIFRRELLDDSLQPRRQRVLPIPEGESRDTYQ